MATFVFVPGAWAGGWQWREVARALRKRGHEVFTPTLTGLGERVHLRSPQIGLETHILDIVNVLKYEDLRNVMLIGYSYGGAVATGVAHCEPERLGKLIYVDGFVLEDGQALYDLYPPEVVAMIDGMAQQFGEGWRVPHFPPDAPYRTDHLLKTYHDPLRANSPRANDIPKAYIYCTEKEPGDPIMAPIARIAAAAKANPQWVYRELATTHSPWETIPGELAQLLAELAGS